MDFPIKNGGSFHCYVSSPEGIQLGYPLGDRHVTDTVPVRDALTEGTSGPPCPGLVAANLGTALEGVQPPWDPAGMDPWDGMS